MKQFFKYVAATIVGLFAFCLIFGIFGFISLIGMVASSSSTPTIKDKSVMVLTLQGEIIDRAEHHFAIRQLIIRSLHQWHKILIFLYRQRIGIDIIYAILLMV